MHVTNGARVAAAMQLLGDAENKIHAAQKVLQYAYQQKEIPNGRRTSTECIGAPTQTPPQGSVDWDEPINGMYPGQIPEQVYIDEEDEECES